MSLKFLVPGLYRAKKGFFCYNSMQHAPGTLFLVLSHDADCKVTFIAQDGNLGTAPFTFRTRSGKQMTVEHWFEKVCVG
jgi:hypothetical protein